MLEVKGITIHNTGDSLSAKVKYDQLVQMKRPNLCHYLVDEKEIIQTWPETEQAVHTGKGYDLGNTNTIAIEICRSTSSENLYLKAQDKAVELIKQLLAKYNLGLEDVYFHMDFNPNYRCPHRILDIYKTKQDFLREVFDLERKD